MTSVAVAVTRSVARIAVLFAVAFAVIGAVTVTVIAALIALEALAYSVKDKAHYGCIDVIDKLDGLFHLFNRRVILT